MLEVESYLAAGNSLDDLGTEFGIHIKRHPVDSLAILNYDQIRSPKTHPIVRECRGLVIDTRSTRVVARSFPRFFNWGEVQEEMERFEFPGSMAQTKEDGSLALFYQWNGEWRINTRGAFAQDPMPGQSFSWETGILIALGLRSRQELSQHLCNGITYVGEFCSPWNQIVRRYASPVVYLLTAFQGLREISAQSCDDVCPAKFLRPARHDFKNIADARAHIVAMSEGDPAYEGVVIRDRHNSRWKIKSPTYLSLHKMRGDGENPYRPATLVPLILGGETAELLTYFPDAKPACEAVENVIADAYKTLETVFLDSWGIASQKEFALSIMGRTPFTGLLFGLRKSLGNTASTADLSAAFRASPDIVCKMLFSKGATQ